MIPALGRSAGMETSQKRRVLSILAVGGVAGAALATGVVGASGGLGSPDEAAASALEPFDSCDELSEYAHEHRWAYNAYPYGVTTDVMFRSSAGARGGQRRARRRARGRLPRHAGPERDRHEHAGDRDRRARHREALGDDALPRPRQGASLLRRLGRFSRAPRRDRARGRLEHTAPDRGRHGAGRVGRLRQQTRHPDRVRGRSRHL